MNNKLKIFILSLVLIVGGTAVVWVYHPTEDETQSVPTYTVVPANILAEGQTIYSLNCASCHGINGEGQVPDNPLVPDETGRYPAPPHNENGHTWHHDDDLLFSIIHDGGLGQPDLFYEMPAFGAQLSADQIQAVLAYIKTLWTDEQRAHQAETTLMIREQPN